MTSRPAAATNTAGTRPHGAGLSWSDRQRRREIKERLCSHSHALLEQVFQNKEVLSIKTKLYLKQVSQKASASSGSWLSQDV